MNRLIPSLMSGTIFNYNIQPKSFIEPYIIIDDRDFPLSFKPEQHRRCTSQQLVSLCLRGDDYSLNGKHEFFNTGMT